MPRTHDTASSRADLLEAFLARAHKHQPGAFLRLDDERVADVDVIPTGAISLDYALGVGGIPRGRITELFGRPMSGKTTLALSVAANAQRAGGNVGIVDAENALSPEHAAWMGLDLHRTVVYQPCSGEDGLQKAAEMMASGVFDVVIVDSVAALVPKAVIDAQIGDANGLGMHARMMSKAMGKLAGLAAQHHVALIFVNQVRKDLGAYGTPDITTGGQALAFYASVRISVSGGQSKSSQIAEGGEVRGQLCKAKVVKNKVAPPFREAEYELRYGQGIAAEAALIQVAEKLGLITRRGAFYTVHATGQTVQGQEKLKAALAGDPAAVAGLTDAVYQRMRAGR